MRQQKAQARYRVTTAPGRFCCKSRKPNDYKNLAKVDFQATPTLQSVVALIRRSVVIFLRSDMVPHVATCNTRQRL